MSEAVDVALIPLLRQYADIADAGSKSHWATAMRRAVGRILALEEYMQMPTTCPCCGRMTECNDDCTLAADCPSAAEAMEYAREVMREAR